MPLRVAYISKFPPQVGGIERHVYEIACRLVKGNNDVRVFTCNDAGETYTIDGIQVLNYRPLARIDTYYWIARPWLIRSFLKDIECFNPDIVHFHLFSNTLELLMPKLCKKYHVAVTPHISIGAGFYGLTVCQISVAILKKIAGNASLLICVSDMLCKWLKKCNLNFRGTIRVIPNGVDTGKYTPPRERTLEKPYRISFVGRIASEKNIPTIIKAFEKIREKLGEVELIIMGKGPLLKKYLKKYGNIRGVQFKGYVPEKEKIRILRLSHLFIFPSLAEAQGISLIEAASCGLPCIASKIGGMPSIVKHGFNGFLVDPFDADKIANYAVKILSNEYLYHKMSINARKFAVENFDWDKVAEKTIKAYMEILDEKGVH
ncbi:hypothetical protein DRO02_05310 [archaeon]|nr:MAG: hypothetical protein DRO02_05310 [archaeon]RLG65413.1 MAG: hypothetical protein DRO21_02060 [archaeon]